MRRLLLPRRRLATALVVAAVACPGVAACSGAVTVESTSTAAAPKSATGPAATATVPMPSATLAGGSATAAQPSMSGRGVPGAEVADAIRSAVGGASSVHMDLTTQAGTGTAAIDLAHKALDLTIGQTNPVRLVYVDGQTYVRGAGTVTAAPSATGTQAPQPTTRRWLQLRPDHSDDLSRRLGTAVDIPAMLRPVAFTDMFANLLGDETPLDNGRRISFWVPAEAYVASVRGGPNLAAALTKPVVVVVELDGDNRPTRLTSTMTSDKSTIVDDTRYSHWGEPVSISAPPQDDTGPAPLPAGASEDPREPQPTTTETASSDQPTSDHPTSDRPTHRRTHRATASPTHDDPRPTATVTVTVAPTSSGR